MPENLLRANFRIPENVVVPKANDADSQITQSPRANVVVSNRGRFIVLPAVRLHGQSLPDAIEIKNVTADWMLPAKFETGKRSTAQDVPEFCFGVS
jgi:hypothetical protein